MGDENQIYGRPVKSISTTQPKHAQHTQQGRDFKPEKLMLLACEMLKLIFPLTAAAGSRPTKAIVLLAQPKHVNSCV